MLRNSSYTTLYNMKSDYSYANIKKQDTLYNIIRNTLYHLFSFLNIYKYSIQYQNEFITVNNSWKESTNHIIIFDNCIQIDEFFRRTTIII